MNARVAVLDRDPVLARKRRARRGGRGASRCWRSRAPDFRSTPPPPFAVAVVERGPTLHPGNMAVSGSPHGAARSPRRRAVRRWRTRSRFRRLRYEEDCAQSSSHGVVGVRRGPADEKMWAFPMLCKGPCSLSGGLTNSAKERPARGRIKRTRQRKTSCRAMPRKYLK
jgi:hypothetical protein